MSPLSFVCVWGGGGVLRVRQLDPPKVLPCPGQQPPGPRETDGPLPQVRYTQRAFRHTALLFSITRVQGIPATAIRQQRIGTPHHTTTEGYTYSMPLRPLQSQLLELPLG